MVRAQAVIGSGYGDEGKGLLVDVLASGSESAVVIRSNGGAQAGHTVTAADGRRHVFHHFGSGALAGARTHLSQFFVSHPMMFGREREELLAMGARVDTTVDPRSPVTTPYDVMINQIVETVRSGGRHGSCGLGFGETLERNLHADFATTIDSLVRHDFRQRLERIREEWLPDRLAALGVEQVPDTFAAALSDDGLIDRYLDDCGWYLEDVTVLGDQLLAGRGQLIFEGAQGLLLDQDYGAFPHVTRSNTGIRNMLAIAEEAGVEAIDAVYVTRAYTTRHGAGPLAHEVTALDEFAVVDLTNVGNPWQGSIRHAPLDTDVLRAAIRHDMAYAEGHAVDLTAALAVTCLDQAVGGVTRYVDGDTVTVVQEDLADAVATDVGLGLYGQSWGPTRATFRA